MGRKKENKKNFNVRMDARKKEILDGFLIELGLSYSQGGSVFPMYGKFLEAIADSEISVLKPLTIRLLESKQ